MALARIKNVEQLRYLPAGELGKILGLDRIPEVGKVREKDLSKYWLEEQETDIGILYVDGHVRTYSGKAAKPPKRYVSRQKLCLRGMVDYWVNDSSGMPVFLFDIQLHRD